jgi:hypothetical protein
MISREANERETALRREGNIKINIEEVGWGTRTGFIWFKTDVSTWLL